MGKIGLVSSSGAAISPGVGSDSLEALPTAVCGLRCVHWAGCVGATVG